MFNSSCSKNHIEEKGDNMFCVETYNGAKANDSKCLWLHVMFSNFHDDYDIKFMKSHK